LAAIVINAMWGSASPRKLERLWRIDRVDFALGFITFFLVLALDLLPAMVAGIVFSIIYVIYRISFPGRTVLGRVADTGDYEAMSWQYGRRGGTTDSKAKPVPGVIVYRFGSPLNFSNAEAFKNTGEVLLINAGAEGSLPHTVVIDCEEMPFVDYTGAEAVSELFNYAQRYGVELSLARVHSGAHKLLQLAGVLEEIGEQRIYDTVRNAVDAATAAAEETTTNNAPAAENSGGSEPDNT
jgi:MFS superfamily sulfate permease-like transporter